MNTIFLFPGQGSQVVGMGKDLVELYPAARLRYEEASEVLGYDLSAICFNGPEEELKQTRVTQPALFVHSSILCDLLKEIGVTPSAAAGHSLGEYSALYSAGVFSFADGLRLVKSRAEAMQKAGTANPGTMAALVGLDDSVVTDICRGIQGNGVVVPANFNSPGQVVISGAVSSVQKALELAKTRGAKMAKELPVSGAFHSPLMQSAADSFVESLAAVSMKAPAFPVISNVTAKPHTDADSIKNLLAQQLLSPVRWSESLTELSQLSDAVWYEVGSGSVLAGLLKRTIKGVSATNIAGADDLKKLRDSMGQPS